MQLLQALDDQALDDCMAAETASASTLSASGQPEKERLAGQSADTSNGQQALLFALLL